MSKKEAQSNLDIIKKVQDDSCFIVEDDKAPTSGIRKVLIFSVISMLLVICIRYLMRMFINGNLDANSQDLEQLFVISRLTIFILYLIPVIMYIVCTYKVQMSLKERRFLKNTFYFPIIVYLLRIFPIICIHINVYYAFALYNSIPIELIVLIIYVIQLKNYTKNDRFNFVIAISVLYLMIYCFMSVFFYGQVEVADSNKAFLDFLSIFNQLHSYCLYFVGIIVLAIVMLFIGKKHEK